MRFENQGFNSFKQEQPAELCLRIKTPVPAILTELDLATEGPGLSRAE